MTGKELKEWVKGIPDESEVVLRIVTIGSDGYATYNTYSTGDDGEEESVTDKGWAASNAGYPDHFLLPREVDAWMAKWHPGGQVTDFGWVPAVRLQITQRLRD